MLIVIGSALSNAGGIGGGGLLIPILLLILKFYTHEAIPISKLMIFTGALTSFILGFKQSHPYRIGITIDYNIPYLIVPFLLFGTMVGVSLNKVLPPWIILVSLTLVLIINTYKTLNKARKMYQKENEQLQISNKDFSKKNYQKQVDEIISSDGNLNAIDKKKYCLIIINKIKKFLLSFNKKFRSDIINKNDEFSINNNMHNNTNAKVDITKLSGLSIDFGEVDKKILAKQEEKKDSRKFPYEKISLMLFSYVFMLLISLIKGSEHFNSIINVKRYY